MHTQNRYASERFTNVRNEYGQVASWAVWAPRTGAPKSGIGDLSIFDPTHRGDILGTIHTRCVLIGLNVSRDDCDAEPWSNFHSANRNGTDYKLRFALQNTPLWGAYMTDVIKSHPDVKSTNVMERIRAEPDLLEINIASLRKEIGAVGAIDPLLIAMGNDARKLLNRCLASEFRITSIPHYAHRMTLESYRDAVSGVVANR